MARFILIDNNSGCIFGDTADYLADVDFGGSMTEAARLMDESIGENGRTYAELSSIPSDTRTGYAVYRADTKGGEAVPVVQDGQDQATINEVEGLCEFVGFVESVKAGD